MSTIVPVALAAVLIILGAIHVYWALTGTVSGRRVIPESNGTPLFTPSRGATMAVALALFIGAFLAVSRGGLFHPASSGSITHWLTIAAGVVFLLRAIGEFRWVRLFSSGGGYDGARMRGWMLTPT